MKATLLLSKISGQGCVILRWSFETIQTRRAGRHLLKRGGKIGACTVIYSLLMLFLAEEYACLYLLKTKQKADTVHYPCPVTISVTRREW